MTYLRPNIFERKVFGPLAMKLGIGGSSTLVIRGQKSGLPRKAPVIAVESAGKKHLVSTRGDAAWVRNLHAAGGRGDLVTKGKTFSFMATEVPIEERGPVIDAYRKVAGKTVERYWKALPDPADHPVFRLDPS